MPSRAAKIETLDNVEVGAVAASVISRLIYPDEECNRDDHIYCSKCHQVIFPMVLIMIEDYRIGISVEHPCLTKILAMFNSSRQEEKRLDLCPGLSMKSDSSGITLMCTDALGTREEYTLTTLEYKELEVLLNELLFYRLYVFNAISALASYLRTRKQCHRPEGNGVSRWAALPTRDYHYNGYWYVSVKDSVFKMTTPKARITMAAMGTLEDLRLDVNEIYIFAKGGISVLKGKIVYSE